MLAGWIIIAFLGDRVWWALPILYGPRWVWALLALGMIPWLLTTPRRAALPAAIAAFVVLFGIMDFRVGSGRLFAGRGATVRVFELNAGAGSGGVPDPGRIVAEIRAEDPDIVVIAECGAGLPAYLQRTMSGYHVHTNTADLCLASKGAIEQIHSRDQMQFWKLSGSGAIVWAVVDTPAGPIRLGMVHLSTPRNALDNYPDLSSIPHLGPVTRANMAERAEESQAARQWIQAGPDLPTIVAGRFQSADRERHLPAVLGRLRQCAVSGGNRHGVHQASRGGGASGSITCCTHPASTRGGRSSAPTSARTTSRSSPTWSSGRLSEPAAPDSR